MPICVLTNYKMVRHVNSNFMHISSFACRESKVGLSLSLSASGSCGTDSSRNSKLADSVAAKNVTSPLSCSASSQPSSKMKYLQKFRFIDGAGDVDFKIGNAVSTYLHLLTVEECEQPLMFWKKQEIMFPHFSLLPKNYFRLPYRRQAFQ